MRSFPIAVGLCIIGAVAPASGQEAKPAKKLSYIKVEIAGVLHKGEDAKNPWSIKVAPYGGPESTWPVGFEDKINKGELEKTAQRLRDKTVIITGELFHIPPMIFNLNPLSTSPPASFPGLTMVVVHTIQEAKEPKK